MWFPLMQTLEHIPVLFRTEKLSVLSQKRPVIRKTLTLPGTFCLLGMLELGPNQCGLGGNNVL